MCGLDSDLPEEIGIHSSNDPAGDILGLNESLPPPEEMLISLRNGARGAQLLLVLGVALLDKFFGLGTGNQSLCLELLLVQLHDAGESQKGHPGTSSSLGSPCT